VTKVHDVEWSFIPVGGPLPLADQPVTAFGAAANMVHPATGFSITRSFNDAGPLADEIAATLADPACASVPAAAARVWRKLWPLEKRTQASFNVFGMELLCSLDLPGTNAFFHTFFNLPRFFWHGYLACKLSSLQLIGFALTTFFQARRPRASMRCNSRIARKSIITAKS
jgi:lycopene cyclase-like protein